MSNYHISLFLRYALFLIFTFLRLESFKISGVPKLCRNILHVGALRDPEQLIAVLIIPFPSKRRTQHRVCVYMFLFYHLRNLPGAVVYSKPTWLSSWLWLPSFASYLGLFAAWVSAELCWGCLSSWILASLLGCPLAACSAICRHSHAHRHPAECPRPRWSSLLLSRERRSEQNQTVLFTFVSSALCSFWDM